MFGNLESNGLTIKWLPVKQFRGDIDSFDYDNEVIRLVYVSVEQIELFCMDGIYHRAISFVDVCCRSKV